MAAPLVVGQYGTEHGHARGVLEALLANPDVRMAGVWEPDADRRRRLAGSGDPVWSRVRWLSDAADLLDDPTVVAVAAEGRNRDSLGHAEEIVSAGKHLLLDKPAGDDFYRFARLVEQVRRRGLRLQLGYMFRQHDGFERIAGWAGAGVLGRLFAVRAHMSTCIDERQQALIAPHRGGILYDLGGHMLDQIVGLLGRPLRVSAHLQSAAPRTPGFVDNTVAVLEYPRALAVVDIAAMEPPPPARRFEVYGTHGSAVLEPFEPAGTLRLCLTRPSPSLPAGRTTVALTERPRYHRSVAAFVAAVRGRPPERSLEHELLVQETLLRASGGLPG